MSYAGLADFVAQLAADPPGPASGSAAAATVAMAAALTELAARRSGENATATRAAATRVRALSLAKADARAYEEVLAAQGAERSAALERANDILHKIAATADEVRALAAPLVDRIEGALRGEALAAVELAEAAQRAAEQLLLVNSEGQPRP